MQTSVLGSSKNLKVFYSIVGLVSIYMMNLFVSCQKSIQKVLHNKSVLKNISFSGFKRWVLGHINQNISLTTFGSPPPPKGIVFPLNSSIPCGVSLPLHWVSVSPSSNWKFVSLPNIYQTMGRTSQKISDFLIRKSVDIKEFNKFIFINMGNHELIIT